MTSDPRDNFERTMAVNVTGVLLCYKYAAIEMIKQGRGGRILGENQPDLNSVESLNLHQEPHPGR